jgi:homoserine kinase
MDKVKVFAPASIGNIGPGYDVLGLAVNGIGDWVEAERCEEGVHLVQVESEETLSMDNDKNTAAMAAEEVLRMLRYPGGVSMRLIKGLPLGSGLGSSAASACAAAYAVNLLYGDTLSKVELVLPATKAEERVSGGFFADNTAPCMLGGATLTRSCLPLDVRRIGNIEELILVLVKPDLKILTRDARAVLPDKIPLGDFVYNMANTALISAAFASGDYGLLARSLNDVVIEPYRAQLIKGYYEVKKNAMDAGADGFAISGSGPTVFAICNSSIRAAQIEDAMVRSFLKYGIQSRSWITKPDENGVRVL